MSRSADRGRGPRPALAALACAALALALAAGLATAQPRRSYPGDPREPAGSPGDSLRTLAGPWQLWTHIGAGWLGAPARIRQRHQAGLGLGMSGDRRLADRFALRARLDFDDLPSTQPDAILLNGIAYSVSADYGHGWFGSALGGAAIETVPNLWLEAAAGAGYFRNGFGSGSSYQDLVTGRQVPLEARSGWGNAWGAGLRYEFQPNRRDRVLGEVQFMNLDRDGTPLRFFAIRFGYRAF